MNFNNMKVLLFCCILQEFVNFSFCQGFNTGFNTCLRPSIAYAKVVMRQRGRMAKVYCARGYALLGQQFLMCETQGSWGRPLPVCVKPGCEAPTPYSLDNGVQYLMNAGAVRMSFCNNGYVLKGFSMSYCNGRNWNGTDPTCEEERVPARTSCDFESEDLCCWMHDPKYDLEWTRQDGLTRHGFILTGPPYDHTLGKNKSGHYMHVHSSYSQESNMSRLISPLFPQSLTQSGCVVFYYYMSSAGSLRVLVHPESVSLAEMDYTPGARSKYTVFEKSGDQGSYWRMAYMDLENYEENFQIVIEAVRGPRLLSGISVDDVSILQHSQCTEKKLEMLLTVNRDSCAGRCKSPASFDIYVCQCTDDCYDLNNCCLDYRDLCVFGDADTTIASEAKTEETPTSLPPPLPTSLKMTSENKTELINLTEETASVAESTSTTLPTTIKSTTTPKPVTSTTSQKTTSNEGFKVATTKKSIQFITPGPPMINATGFFKRTFQNTTTNATDVRKFVTAKAPTTVTPMTTTVTTKNAKVTRNTVKSVVTISTVPTVEIVSKTFAHYEKYKVGLTTQQNVGQLEKTGNESSPDEIPAISSAFLASCAGVIILAIAGAFIFFNRTSLTSRWMRRGTAPDDVDNVRFLVDQEELEHELND